MLKRALSLCVALSVFAGMAAGQSGPSPSLSFIDRWGEDAPQLVEYDLARIRLTDPSLDVSGERDTVSVNVSSVLGPDLETVTLTETGKRTGVFEGGIDLRINGGSPAFPGILETMGPSGAFDSIQVDGPGGLSDTAQVVPSIVRLVDDQGDEAPAFAAGGRVFVRLIDRLSDNPLPDTTTVTLTTSSGDSEVLTLTESAVRGGEFLGSIPGRLAAGATPGDGILDTLSGDTLTASHEDVNNVTSSSDTAPVSGATLRFVDSQGLPASIALAETKITLQAINASADFNPLSVDFVYATLTSNFGGESETLALWETGASTGVFEGRMRVTSSQYSGPGDGRIRISPSNTDPDIIEGSISGTAPATIRATGSLTRLLDAWGNDAETFPRGGTLTVRVEDPSLINPYYGFRISTAVVQSQTTGDVESLPVHETGVGTSVFEGTIVLETGAAVPGDGKLQAQVEGELLIAEHADATGLTASSDTGRLSSAEMWFLDDGGRPAQTVLENGTLRLRLFDSSLSTPPTADVVSEVSGDGENLFFSAVPGSLGSFEGSMPTEHLSWGTPPGDGILSTRYDESSLDDLDTIRAFALNTSASARAAFSELHFVDSHGNEAESFAVGETLHVRLRFNAFGTPGIDQSWVLLLSPVTGDSETVTLTETGPETNVYQGSLPTGTGAASIADGQLQVRIGEMVVAQEDRADGPFAFALDSAAITASRVTFVDQDNVPVETFLRGGWVYLEAFDRAANEYANGIESLDVTVRTYADRDGRLVDTETVSLTETGNDTALFRGAIPMSINSSGTSGILDTAYYPPYEGPDRLRATRGDSTDSAGLTDSILRFLDASGNDASTYPVGGTIYLRLLRGRGTSSESLVDTVPVYLSSWTDRAAPLGSFDSVSLELTETGLDTGVFEGQITATAGPADFNDNLFQVSSGGEIQVQFSSSWTEDGDRAFIVDSVTPENDPPVAGDDSATVDEGSFVEIDVLANDTDPDGDTLSIVSYTQGTKGSVSASGAGLLYTPNAGLTGADSFTYTVEDPSGATATATVSVTILVVNNPPVAVADNITLDEDTPLGFALLANDYDPDGDTLTISAATNGSHGSTIRFSYSVFYSPNANYFGTDSFTYTVSDGKGGTAAGTVFVTVNPVNDAPSAVNDNVVINEDTPVTINVLANDSDVEGDPLTITSATQGSRGAVTVNAGATVTYTPNPNATGVDTFTYTVSDGNGGTKTATVWMSINAVNDPPNAVNDAQTTPEGTAAVIAVLANDSDPENQTLTVTAVTQGANGSVVANANNTVTYTPAGGFAGSDSFTYTISDGSLTATASVAVTVTPANQPPHAVEDEVTVAEDGTVTIDVLANDTDPNGDPLSVPGVLPATHGVAVRNGDFTVTYTPKPDFHGEDFFVYTVSDPSSATNSATVLITITPVDDAPVAVADAATVAEDSPATTVNVLANDTDVDGGPMSISAVTQPANGTVVITGGGTGLTYQPNANFCNTPDTFTYTLAPGGSTATVTVAVTCVDDNPVAVADAATVLEDSGANAINVLVNDTDVDAGPISITSVTQPASGTVVITNGGTDLAYTPNANLCGTPDTFTYTLAPGGSTAAVSMTVTCVNDGPVVDLDANDDQGTSGNGFAVTFTEGEAAKLIEDPLDATVTDVDSATLASLTVTITNLLDLGSETLSADVTGTSITADYVSATGVLTLTGPDTLANFEAVLRKVTYLNTDEDSDATPRAIRFVANDGSVDGNVALSTVTVVLVDDPPAAVDDVATVTEDSGANAIDVLANDTDPDGGAISISSVTQPANGTVVITGGGTGLTYQPNANFCTTGTPDAFTYTLAPGSSAATVTVTVICVNDLPTAVADAATVSEDSGANTIYVLNNDTDTEGDVLVVSAVSQGTKGVVTNANGSVTYTPNANANGADSFTYTVSDGNGGSDTATVSITINGVNDAPDAVNDVAATAEDTVVIVTVLANDTDVDGNPLQVTAVTQGTKGTVTINPNGTVTYTPALHTNGADAFTYTVSDGNGGSDTATVTVSVAAVNDAPVAAADTATTREGAAVNVSVLANDSDVEGDTLTVTSATTPAGGTAAVNADNTVTYTPDANFNGTDSFTYEISDGNGGTAAATVTVTVADALERVAILATHGVWIQTGADVLSGDVIVNQAGTAPFLTGSVELTLAGSVTTPAGYDVQANRISVASGATVESDVYFNQLTGTVTGPETSPLTLPVFSTLPPFLTATPGTTDVNVGNNGSRTLAAGSYRDLIVGRRGTVTFTGGTYHFRTIRIDREAKLFFTAAATVRVQQKLTAQQTAQIRPAAGAPIDGSDVVIHVGGVNGTGGGLTETPKAVELAADNVIWANVYAPNGTIWMRDRTEVQGVLLGKDVQLGPDVQVTLDSSFTGQ